MICLGIESTAHTFSIGLVNEKCKILGLVSDLYKPEFGGLKPSAVVEHHYQCFDRVLTAVMDQAHISFSAIDVIAFAQGPGLGPCLRLGAVFARSLAQKLDRPLVGVNHCIGHIEIGRALCGVEDPITLYVSGGNTIISAFESHRYQIFGETMDIAIGNMLDMVGRDIGIPHPGGPRIEKLAKNSSTFFPLPYVVKGMDLSYSGLYSAVRKRIKAGELTLSSLALPNLIYSLQETAFAMLAEVFERALAHTHKKTALLTGGVAANKRLQKMIHEICKEHGTTFHVVPQQAAGDNGAMIAWTGLLKFTAQGADKLQETTIRPKWRLDTVEIPWRVANSTNIPCYFVDTSSPQTVTPSDEEILAALPFSGTIITRGAEAALIHNGHPSRSILMKYRYQKQYRHAHLDLILRKTRTVQEARNMIFLNECGIPVPLIHRVVPSQGQLTMQYLPWKTVREHLPQFSEQEIITTFYEIGKWIAKIHQQNMIHGDLTTSNILWHDPRHIMFIDFGLSQRDANIEDFAMDIHLFKQVLISTHGDYYRLCYSSFTEGYEANIPADKVSLIYDRIAKIELRGRYVAKEERRKPKKD